MKNQATKKFAINPILAAITILCSVTSIYVGVTLATDAPEAAVAAVAIKSVTAVNTPWTDNPLKMSSTLSEPIVPVVTKPVVIEPPANFIPVSAVGSIEGAPFSKIQLSGVVSGADAITQLGDKLDDVAKWYGFTPAGFTQQLLADNTMHVDSKGRVVYVDDQLVTSGDTMATATMSASVATAGTATPFPYDQTFTLHSKPDSTRTLYLNFTGQGTNPAFDMDKSPATFNNAERLVIQKVWMRVAEAYSAFDVDVTTVKPTDLTNRTGSVILITPQASSAGGYAYLRSFVKLNPDVSYAFCFPNNLAWAEKYISDCVSHELGHTLGLNHQGQLPSTAYYTGQGSGDTGWAPIMGVGYYKNMPQWSKGEYARANNKEDAYAVMLKQGLPLRVATNSAVLSVAPMMTSTVANGYNNISASGIIRAPGDANAFRFAADAGPVSITASPYMLGGALHASLQLIDGKGTVLATSTNELTRTATIKMTLPAAGNYYLKVSGRGAGDPLKTGYTNYGSIGQYTIVGTTVPQAVAVK